MQHFNERVALRMELENLFEEKEQLTKRHREVSARVIDISKRLDVIDKETRVHNTQNPDLLEVLVRMCTATEKSTETMELLKPSISMDLYTKLVREEIKSNISTYSEIIEEETQTVSHKRTITKQTSEEEETTTIRRKRHDLKKESATVAEIIKSFGRPVKFADILKALEEEHEIKWGSPHVTMGHIVRHQPKIEKVGYGLYQFRL